MRKIDGDALIAIIRSWFERTAHGEQKAGTEQGDFQSIWEILQVLPQLWGQDGQGGERG